MLLPTRRRGVLKGSRGTAGFGPTRSAARDGSIFGRVRGIRHFCCRCESTTRAPTISRPARDLHGNPMRATQLQILRALRGRKTGKR